MEDEKHKREQAKLRGKRKAAKSSKSEGQRERERLRDEHKRKILGSSGGGGSSSHHRSDQNKRQKSSSHHQKGGKHSSSASVGGATPSSFQNLFTQRAGGFQIDFKFRNAPPRPPVGPCFVGHSLDSIIIEQSKTYKPLNAVEVNYTWKLHSEPDLGVPLAPSAMDLNSYNSEHAKRDIENVTLHPDDDLLLNWTGSMGDSAQQELKVRQDRARAQSRLALEGKGRKLPSFLLQQYMNSESNNNKKASSGLRFAKVPGVGSTDKKAFSRVLDEQMQNFMRKTTYLSNNFSRKVHDFKSLAATKKQQRQDLEQKQQVQSKRRSSQAISHGFQLHNDKNKNINYLVHPTKKNLKAKSSLPLLPHADHWGYAYTHVVIDKKPTKIDLNKNNINRSFIANVEKRKQSDRLSCQLWLPQKKQEEDNNDNNNMTIDYKPLQQYDLDVLPLKEEDQAHVNFCFWMDNDGENRYVQFVPISSRVQLSTGRPIRKIPRKVVRRKINNSDRIEMEERVAEIDMDVATKIGKQPAALSRKRGSSKSADDKLAIEMDDSDGDGVGDMGDDDDSDEDEATFGDAATKTIVAN